jgi:hypothetical protein
VFSSLRFDSNTRELALPETKARASEADGVEGPGSALPQIADFIRRAQLQGLRRAAFSVRRVVSAFLADISSDALPCRDILCRALIVGSRPNRAIVNPFRFCQFPVSP